MAINIRFKMPERINREKNQRVRPANFTHRINNWVFASEIIESHLDGFAS